MNRLRNLAFATVVTAGAISAGAACSAKKNTELVVAVQTDLRIPKDLNAVNIKIVALGGTYFDQTFVVGPGGVHLPQTIGVIPNDDKNLQPVDITVTGRFGSDVSSAQDKVIRRVRVTFAKDRVGLVRMPLRFTCYGEAKINECGSEETCVAGKCVTVPQLEGADLPAFTNDAVFGAGGDDQKLGKCWSPDVCLAASVPLKPVGSCVWSLTEATVAGDDGGTSTDGSVFDASVMDAVGPPDVSPADSGGPPADGGSSGGDDASAIPDAKAFMWKRFQEPSKVSVVVTSDKGLGFCNGSSCKLPLDFDENEGWSWGNDSHTLIKLAPNLCATLGAARVEATDACDTKTAEVPFCDETASGQDASLPESTPPEDASTGKDGGCGGTCGAGMCGPIPDGCGGMFDCGGCGTGMMCDFGTHTCRGVAPDTGPSCPAPMMMCGPVCTDTQHDPNNCGFCGNVCGASDGCSGGKCMGADAIAPPDTSCMPMTCAMLAGKCGPVPDGCGSSLDCMCSSGFSCVAGACMPAGADSGTGADTSITDTGVVDTGPDACVKKTCADYPATCGPQSDGCGGLIPSCGTCVSPSICGGGGPSKCGPGTCTPSSCAMVGASCGIIGDGCGGTLACGSCPPPSTCGGGGIPNACGGGAPGDASTDGGAASDPCGMSSDSPPLATTPFKQGYHLSGPTFGAPMTPGPTLVSTSMSPSGGFSSGLCSSSTTANFNGTSSYISGADGMLGSTTSSLEVSAWIYLDPAAPPAANATVISTIAGTKGFFVGADATGKPTFVVYMNDGTSRAATASTATIASPGWYHFAGSAIAGKPIQLFSNGAPLATGGLIDKPIAAAPDVSIGRALSGASGYWKGPLGEIRIYGN